MSWGSSFLPEKTNRHRITRKDELTPDYTRKDELTPDYTRKDELTPDHARHRTTPPDYTRKDELTPDYADTGLRPAFPFPKGFSR